MTSPRTLRQLAGIAPLAALDPKRSVLVLIDIQQDYFDAAKLPIPEAERVAGNAAVLLDFADAAGLPVLHVQHVSPAGSGLFARDSAGVAFHPRVAPRAGHEVITKTLPSAFAGTELDAWLRERGIETLIVCGMMTHMCVDSTAREAAHRGYKAVVVADACATRDLPGPDGTTIPAATIHVSTLAALGDRFAEVLDVAQLRSLPLV
jgi:nicotinamidase-related amidase